MTIALRTPREDDLSGVVRVLGEWQDDSAPFQLHPGDVGWFGWHGDEVTTAALRVWVRDDRPVAIGLLDGPGLLRLTVARPLVSEMPTRVPPSIARRSAATSSPTTAGGLWQPDRHIDERVASWVVSGERRWLP